MMAKFSVFTDDRTVAALQGSSAATRCETHVRGDGWVGGVLVKLNAAVYSDKTC